jgi:hypothetical protein
LIWARWFWIKLYLKGVPLAMRLERRPTKGFARSAPYRIDGVCDHHSSASQHRDSAAAFVTDDAHPSAMASSTSRLRSVAVGAAGGGGDASVVGRRSKPTSMSARLASRGMGGAENFGAFQPRLL